MGLGDALKVARTFCGTRGENSWAGGAAAAVARMLDNKIIECIAEMDTSLAMLVLEVERPRSHTYIAGE